MSPEAGGAIASRVFGAVVVHSAGINWGQALVTGVTIVVGILTIVSYFSRAWNRRRSKSQASLEKTINGAVDKAAETIRDALGKVETKLDQHIAEHEKPERRRRPPETRGGVRK